jgi:hypothetical protein
MGETVTAGRASRVGVSRCRSTVGAEPKANLIEEGL